MIDIFEISGWMMTNGERAALEGVLSRLKPTLAVEVGTAMGGSLGRTAAHSQVVHSFDLDTPPDAEAYANVTFHTGNSHVTLRPWLDGLDEPVRYVLIDGDHSVEGARQDILDVLESGALNGVMLIHDAINPLVHRALRQIPWHQYPAISHVDYGFVAGGLQRRGIYAGQLWGGLALVIVGDYVAPPELASRGTHFDLTYDPHTLARPLAEVVGRPRWLLRRVRSKYGGLTGGAGRRG